jgi:hypothetical protein
VVYGDICRCGVSSLASPVNSALLADVDAVVAVSEVCMVVGVHVHCLMPMSSGGDVAWR